MVVVLSQQQVAISFCWIPSHVGIEGNELADEAAKLATSNGRVHRLETPATDIIAYVKSKIKDRWQQVWFNIQDNKKLRKIQSTTNKAVFKLSRKDQMKVTRLRIGHTRLTHGYLLVAQEQPICVECTWDEDDPVYLTVEHILLECGNYALDRLPCYEPTNLTMKQLLSEQKYIYQVIRFLHISELYNKI